MEKKKQEGARILSKKCICWLFVGQGGFCQCMPNKLHLRVAWRFSGWPIASQNQAIVITYFSVSESPLAAGPCSDTVGQYHFVYVHVHCDINVYTAALPQEFANSFLVERTVSHHIFFLRIVANWITMNSLPDFTYLLPDSCWLMWE